MRKRRLNTIYWRHNAEINVGECYELGKGVSKNLSKSLEWYRIAAERGDEDAQKKVQELMK